MDAAACFHGVEFGGSSVARKGSGLYKNPGAVRQTEALRDLGSFESSLHLSPRSLGTWPVRLSGTQTQMTLARVINPPLSPIAKPRPHRRLAARPSWGMLRQLRGGAPERLRPEASQAE